MGRIGSLAFLVVFLSSSIPAVAVQYHLARLPGVLADSSGNAFQINEHGDILGEYGTAAGPVYYLLRGTVRTDLQLGIPGFPADGCSTHGLGEDGEVVGHCWYFVGDDYFEQGYVWRDGVTTGLGYLPGSYRSWARKINARGQVLGGAVERHPDPVMPGLWIYSFHQVLWDDGVPMRLGLEGALAINNADPAQIVGYDGSRPVKWASGTMSSLPCPAPLTRGAAVDVNDAGQAIGFCSETAIVFWEADGTAVELAVPARVPVASCAAYYINNAGTVVGHCGYDYFLWDRDHGARWIRDLLDGSGAGWNSITLQDINGSGTIVGYAMFGSADPTDPGFVDGLFHAIILTPVSPDDDGDGSVPPADCDDGDPLVHPGALEVCDGKDNDCNGQVDEALPQIVASQEAFAFEGVQGGPAPATQVLTITNPGCGSFSWSAAADASWLTLGAASGGNGASTVLGVDTTGLPVGVSSATVTVSAVGDVSFADVPVMVSVTVTPDVTPPLGSILIANGAAATNRMAVRLDLMAGDPGGSGVEFMRFSNGDGRFSAWEPYQSAKEWTLTSGAGIKTVKAQFRDKAGNLSDADPLRAGAQWFEDRIVYDVTPPAGSVLIDGWAYATRRRAVALVLSATDPGGAGVGSMRFSNGGGVWSAWEPYSVRAPWTLTAGAGTKVVHAQFRDRAGNISDADPLKAGKQPYSDTIRLLGF